MDTQITQRQENTGLSLTTLPDMYDFAKYVAKSPFAPKGMEQPEAIVAALQCGMELGLAPMQSLQNIAVINGRPSIYGDAALALVRSSGQLEDYREEEVGEQGNDTYGIRVTVKRRGFNEMSDTFRVADAKAAGLWGKSGPWSQYPRRMLKFRARGFVLRDAFGDVLKGLVTREEAEDSRIVDVDTAPEEAADAAFAAMTGEGPEQDEKAPKQAHVDDTGVSVKSDTQSKAQLLKEAAKQSGILLKDLRAWAKSKGMDANDEADATMILSRWDRAKKSIDGWKGTTHE